jgi:putative membrane protein
MIPNPYERFRDREFTLNDYLAIDRTVLANERTVLAYSRTFLAMLVIGGSCIKFFDSLALWIVGGLFIAGSIAVGASGWYRYRRTQRRLAVAIDRDRPERHDEPRRGPAP